MFYGIEGQSSCLFGGIITHLVCRVPMGKLVGHNDNNENGYRDNNIEDSDNHLKHPVLGSHIPM
jgi:hypothetical protein